MFDENLNLIKTLSNLQSPAGLTVDDLDFLHVLEYAGRVDFQDFINYEDLGIGDLLDLAGDIRNGIRNEDFVVKIFDRNQIYKKSFVDHIDFPLDLAFDHCDKLFVDNSEVFGTNIFVFVPSRLEFDLEMYRRSPTADITPPEAICVSDFEITLNSTETRNITAEDIDDGSNDVCGDVTLAIDKDNFTADDEGDNTVTLTVTDEQGNESTCSTIVKVIVEEADTPPIFQNCPSEIIELENDTGQCGAVFNFQSPSVNDDNGTITPIRIDGNTDLTSGDLFPVGTTTITFQADDGVNDPVTCSFDIIVNDEEKPVIDCSAGAREITLAEGETYSIPDFESEIVFSDNCDSSLSYSQTPGEGTEINTTTEVNIMVTDAAGNENSCSFTVTVIEESPELQITNCPGPQTFEVDENCAYLIPDIAAMIETNIPEAVITQNIEAGFEVHGDLTLTITATYEDQTDTCEVQLLAKDSIAPSITCPSDQSETIGAGESFQLPNYVLQSDSSDNCAIASFQQVPEVGTQVTETTEVTLTVTDEDGNATSCSFTVNIEVTNEETLQINCPQNYTLQADANCNYFVPDFSTIVTTNIDGATIEQDQVAGTNFDPNSDPYLRVTATYEDQSDYCDIYLLPDDQIAPTAQCIQEYQVTLDEGETVEIDPLDLDGGSADNCGIASYALSQTQFSSADEGVQDIRFTVTDNFGNSDECTVAIRVVVNTAGNQAPLANPDMYETLMNTTLEVPAGQGILSNDSDPEGDDLNIVLIDQTSNGSLSLNDDGSFRYIPNEGFFGMDNFTYYINDGELDSETVEVSINVLQQENQRPVSLVDEYSTSVNTVLEISAPGVLANDYDPEGDEIFAYLNSDPTHGSVTLLEDGSFTYTPDPDFVGVDRFSYYATDGSGEGLATVTINVLDDSQGYPVANPDSYTTAFNTTLNISEENGILANDNDPNGDQIFAVLVDDVTNGTLELNADGSFTYTPNNGFSGEDQFTYHATDGQLNSGTVTVTIFVEAGQTGYFRCAEDLTIFLRENADFTVDITTLYSGNVEGINVEASQLVFGCEDIGESEITLTYSGAQNGSCVIPVTVLDRAAPDLQLRDMTLQIGSEGIATLRFEDIDNGSSDFCSDTVLYELSREEFTCDDLGENLVEVRATDEYGNTTTGTVIITVEGDNCGTLPPGTEYTFVYPNPNSGSFKVATPSDVSVTRMEVFDHRGRFIAGQDYKGDFMEYSMDIGPLQEAAYVLKIMTNKGMLVKRIIIKN